MSPAFRVFDAKGKLPDTFEAHIANVVTNITRTLSDAGAPLCHLFEA